MTNNNQRQQGREQDGMESNNEIETGTSVNRNNNDNEPRPATATTSSTTTTTNNNKGTIKFSEIKYSISSFYAIVKPVTITMILTAISVVFISTEESKKSGEEQLSSTYTVFSTTSDDTVDQSNVQTLGLSVANATIIVCVIGAMTFLIVILYKYKCFKCLIGWMMISSGLLLGFVGGSMFNVAIDKYKLNIDMFSYYFFLYNFAFVGVISIFGNYLFSGFGGGDYITYNKGIVPTYITQSYLIITSVLLAWQLSHFDSWTAWTLLVLLALYDLCAVLTPCGPLKALVNIMSKDDAPGIMPGLLYEAEFSSSTTNNNTTPQSSSQRQRRQQQRQQSRQSSHNDENANQTSSRQIEGDVEEQEVRQHCDEEQTTTTTTNASQNRIKEYRNTTASSSTIMADDPAISSSSSTMNNNSSCDNDNSDSQAYETVIAISNSQQQHQDNHTSRSNNVEVVATQQQQQQQQRPPTGLLPFAIAKIYKVRIVEPIIEPTYGLPEHSSTTNSNNNNNNNNNDDEQTLPTSPNDLLALQYTKDQLNTIVTVMFPRNGGRIDCIPSSSSSGDTDTDRNCDDGPSYIVLDRNGNVKRTLHIDHDGRVYEKRTVTVTSSTSNSEDEFEDRNSIKLGLGDFIFYSVLVSKAALYSFTTFAICTLVILCGLGFTLILLSVYHHALPALPISIFLGVVFYLLTRYVIEPYIQDIFTTDQFYV